MKVKLSLDYEDMDRLGNLQVVLDDPDIIKGWSYTLDKNVTERTFEFRFFKDILPQDMLPDVPWVIMEYISDVREMEINRMPGDTGRIVACVSRYFVIEDTAIKTSTINECLIRFNKLSAIGQTVGFKKTIEKMCTPRRIVNLGLDYG